tara:strand:- start:1928 stop:2608 length:681 start_codon:yes stop_codon:yes gene_type:complete
MEKFDDDIVFSNLITIKRNLRTVLNSIPTNDPLYDYLVLQTKKNTLNIMHYELQKLSNYNNLSIKGLNTLIQQFSGLLDIIMIHPKKIINNKLYIYLDIKLISILNGINIDYNYDNNKNWFDYEIKNNYVQYFIYENTSYFPDIQELDISIGEEIIIIIDQKQYNNILEINMAVNTNIRRYYLVKQIDENNLIFQIFFPHYPHKNNYEIINTLLNDIIHKKFTVIK